MGKKIIFCIGDDVQVVRRSLDNDTWCPSMYKTIGKCGKVIRIDDPYVLVEVYPDGSTKNQDRWWYLDADLTNLTNIGKESRGEW